MADIMEVALTLETSEYLDHGELISVLGAAGLEIRSQLISGEKLGY